MKYKLVTFGIFVAAVLFYIVGMSYSNGYFLLLGTIMEIWCLFRAGKRKKPFS